MTSSPSPVAACWSEYAQQALYANRWFAALSGAHQHALLAAGRRILLRDGQLFAAQGQSIRKRRDGFGVLVEGLLKVSSSSPDGHEAILSFVRPGQWFGELALLDGHSRERDFLSVGDSEVLVIEPDAMHGLMQDAKLTSHITRLLAARNRTLLSLVEGFTLRSTRARTARRLVMLAFDDEPENACGRHRATLDVSQDALASMLGMTRQSVASQLRQLCERGAISQAYGRVNIASMVVLLAESV